MKMLAYYKYKETTIINVKGTHFTQFNFYKLWLYQPTKRPF